jgi:hypothetical protein
MSGTAVSKASAAYRSRWKRAMPMVPGGGMGFEGGGDVSRAVGGFGLSSGKGVSGASCCLGVKAWTE